MQEQDRFPTRDASLPVVDVEERAAKRPFVERPEPCGLDLAVGPEYPIGEMSLQPPQLVSVRGEKARPGAVLPVDVEVRGALREKSWRRAVVARRTARLEAD